MGLQMAGRSSQRKGADVERELAALLRNYGSPVVYIKGGLMKDFL